MPASSSNQARRRSKPAINESAGIRGDTASPLTIFVAWHPKCADGQFLASEIFRWFRGNPRDLDACARGIPVLYRCWEQDGEFGEAPLDLPQVHDPSAICVFVPLIDEHFAVCRQWRNYLHRAVGRADAGNDRRSTTIVFPVALHAGAFQILGRVQNLNFLRADRGGPIADETQDTRRARRAAGIRNQLTDALGRLVTAHNSGFAVEQFGQPPTKVSVFISHAKIDGAVVAGALRDEVRRRGQLEAFFDENDLAYGFDYRQGLEDALSEDKNTLLLAVLTDAYASRPWCRYELRRFRQIRFAPLRQDSAAQIGRALPVVVVDALANQSIDHLPDIGPSPVFRYRDDNIGLIVDGIQRVVLQYAYNLQRARALPLGNEDTTWVLNAPPDLRTIVEVQTSARAARQQRFTVVFPGPGVRADALEDWCRLFPDVTFRTFEDVEIDA